MVHFSQFAMLVITTGYTVYNGIQYPLLEGTQFFSSLGLALIGRHAFHECILLETADLQMVMGFTSPNNPGRLSAPS